jgi:F0F1-type ATP synthase assembly protein I
VAGEGPELGDLLSMGVTLALCVAAGFGLGWLVDMPFGTFPVFALVGLLLGVGAASLYVYKLFERYSGKG